MVKASQGGGEHPWGAAPAPPPLHPAASLVLSGAVTTRGGQDSPVSELSSMLVAPGAGTSVPSELCRREPEASSTPAPPPKGSLCRGSPTKAPGRRGFITITKTLRTWLEIKQLPGWLSKAAGVVLRAGAFSPSARPPLLGPLKRLHFHVSFRAPLPAPAGLASKSQN